MITHLISRGQFNPSRPPKIAIVRSLPGLGDLLCLVPALRALRIALPEAQITLIGLPNVVQFVERFSFYLDDWLEFPGYPGIPEVPLSAQRVVSFLSRAQQLHFDCVLQMHGNGSAINGFALLLGAKITTGFYPAGCPCPDTDRFLPYPEHEPEMWRHLRLMEFLGIPLQGDQLEFPLHALDYKEFECIQSTYNLQAGHYICLHPGASISDRQWGYLQFARVADTLADQGWQIVVTGTAAEVALTQSVIQAMHYPAVNLAGKTSLGAMAVLLTRSRLLICNDTGISHLAAALQTNSVVIFSNSDPHRWAPLNRQRHRILDGTHHVITPDHVLREAATLLQQEVVYAS